MIEPQSTQRTQKECLPQKKDAKFGKQDFLLLRRKFFFAPWRDKDFLRDFRALRGE
jgi:hypothetical protein